MSLGSEGKTRVTAQDERTLTAADLHPTIEDQGGEDSIAPEGSGDADDQVIINAQGDICDDKPETGNRTLQARFGHRRSHNEELTLCVIVWCHKRA